MKIFDRIRDLREKLGMTQEELALKTGYKSRSTINKIEKGLRDINQSQIELFATALETTPAYLMGWEDEPNMIQPRFQNADIIKSVRKKKLPLVGNIACGSPMLNFNDSDEIEYIDADENICADFALRCVGDSMINARIEDGDLVFIDKDARVKDGDIAAVSIDFEITLKRVYFKENSVVLMAENAKIPPRIFEFKEESQIDFQILGKAVAFQSMIR